MPITLSQALTQKLLRFNEVQDLKVLFPDGDPPPGFIQHCVNVRKRLIGRDDLPFRMREFSQMYEAWATANPSEVPKPERKPKEPAAAKA